MPEKPAQELVVALAGPLVNVVIAAGLFLGLQLSGQWQSSLTLSATGGSLVERLMVVNVFLVLFNLLPAFPMDGGRVLRALLALRMNYVRATRVAAAIGQGMAVLFGLWGLFYNPMLLLIAVFVWIGAAQEAAAVQMKSSLRDALVREAMMTRFSTLPPHARVGEAIELLLGGSQQDFPVVEDGRVRGILSRAALLKALGERGEGALVGDVMETQFDAMEAEERLDQAIGRLNPERGFTRPVFQQGALVGLLTAENLGEFYMVRSALEHRAQAKPPRLPPTPQPPIIPQWEAARRPAA